MINNLTNTWSIISKKNKNYFLLILILSLIASLLEVLSIGIIIPVLSFILDPISLENFFFYPYLNKFINISNELVFTIYLIICLILVFFLKNFLLSIFSWFQISFINDLKVELSRKLYNIYLKLPYSFHLKNNSSILYRKIDFDISNASMTLSKFITLIIESLVFVSVLIFLLIYEFEITLLCSFFIFLIGSIFYLSTKSKLKSWGKQRQFFAGEFLKSLFHGLHSIKDVKMLNREDSFVGLLHQNLSSAVKFSKFELIITTLTKYWLEFISIIGLGTLICFMKFFERTNNEIIITIGLFGAAIYRLAPSLNKILASVNSIQFLSSSTKIVKEEFENVLKEPLENNNQVEIINFFDHVNFCELSFKFPNSSNYIFKETNFTIKKNSITGVFGKSGSGKTTLINLVCGLIKPDSGYILIDDTKYNFKENPCKLKIGYVSQSTALIDDTLAKNIAFGIPDNSIKGENLNRCIEISRISNFIETLPKGLNTRIGEKGTRLSGGQQQRVGIARALYSNPDLLIIDEGTNSLDKKTEREILDEIKSLKKDLSIILVSHDMDLISSYSDHIFELKDQKLKKI